MQQKHLVQFVSVAILAFSGWTGSVTAQEISGQKGTGASTLAKGIHVTQDALNGAAGQGDNWSRLQARQLHGGVQLARLSDLLA